MKKEFWINKWKNKEIGFHQENYNEYLTEFWPEICKDKQAVLVPLCGKTKDMLYLIEKGHQVIGIDVSEIAAKEFFLENKIEFEVREEENYKVFFNEDISFFVGDIFDIKLDELKGAKYLFDRASLIALPPEIRKKLAHLLFRDLKITDGLVITMSFDDDELGPPFSVPPADVVDLLAGKYKITEVETHIEQGSEVTVHSGKISTRFEHIMRLSESIIKI